MSLFKCKMCGGALEISNNETVATCEYCGTQQTLPKLDDERRANLYDRANHFRRNNEFDKAMGIYEQILNEDNTDAEAYWSLVLCRYGIEYVEDPSSHKRISTVNRAQFTSVFDDDNYKSALEYADSYQKSIYEEEAKTINEIQKGILAISQKEEPFDVFICYKESDNNGRRTPDSVLANDLYHQLTQEGFKVFFARITLEDKLGSAYEPYIFAALNSAKVMVALGTKPEFFNAVWVKNEWSRYLALIKQGQKKMLIPAYKDMDPYDLPEEFSHLQAQDMSKLGFMQDLIRGIKKIVAADEPKTATVVKETVVTTSVNADTAPLLKRAFMFLEDSDWKSANEYCEKVLDIDPECADAYLGKLMSELRVGRKENLKNCAQPFEDRNNYQKTIRFGNDAMKKQLEECIEFIYERNENARLEGIYNVATDMMNDAETENAYLAAAEEFLTIPECKNSKELADKCKENAEIARKDAILAGAEEYIRNFKSDSIDDYEDAISLLKQIPGWKNADDLIIECNKKIEEIRAKAEADRLEKERKEAEARAKAEIAAKRNKWIAVTVTAMVCVIVAAAVVYNTVVLPNNKYNAAIALMEEKKYDEAIIAFKEMNGYKDSADKITECLDVKYNAAIALMEEKKYNEAIPLFADLEDFKDASEQLKKAVEVCNEKWKYNISARNSNTLAIKYDGTALGKFGVKNWTDIVALSSGYNYTVGLKSDGTVVATEYSSSSWPYEGQCEVEDWEDIVAVSAGHDHTVGLKSDGTVVAVGSKANGKCNVEYWEDIVQISAGTSYTVGLKSDGTVVATKYSGWSYNGECDVEDWEDIVQISAGHDHTVGLKSDGTVVAVGNDYLGKCDVEDWTDIVAISAGRYHTVGLKSDGTVVAAGNKQSGKCKVDSWTDIIAVFAGDEQTIGLKSDGTIVSVGDSGYKADTENWNLFE